jgi:hypothetical protein
VSGLPRCPVVLGRSTGLRRVPVMRIDGVRLFDQRTEVT